LTADKTLQMEPRQHLYAEPIYRINSELQNIVELHPNTFNEQIQLVPCFFDRQRRRFRWLSVHKANWRWNEKLLTDCRTALNSLFDNWDSESQILAERWYEPLPQENGEWNFGALKDRWQEIRYRETCKNWYNEGSCHRALLDLVAGRATPRDRYIEGLVLELIAKAASQGRPVKFVDSGLIADGYDEFLYKPAKFTCHYSYGEADTGFYW
jgi:hypothetical protein